MTIRARRKLQVRVGRMLYKGRHPEKNNCGEHVQRTDKPLRAVPVEQVWTSDFVYWQGKPVTVCHYRWFGAGPPTTNSCIAMGSECIAGSCALCHRGFHEVRASNPALQDVHSERNEEPRNDEM